ncbi:hypothetical protein RB614_11375 [Phytohabitans sp. ZYX-F-186]|uniref:Uncharacterized protein n=1 Tax=Phytohabitans maris TaxID=3071409 RepID=A0ABU0ZGR8_9ACTN|nr:hypothetical protein [Phytohabitans sp. ZYX-F-186]MDQ7905122.1 hypothetical protein [Phytohabitans sp. ZYX-F-186]
MSTPVLVTLAVGGPVPLAHAGAVAAVAEEVGVAAIRLVDAGHTLDPTVVAAYLAGVHSGLGYVAEVPTTGNAPYNAARRLLSLDRAAGGRIGVALRAGEGDEVSEATVPDPAATDPVRRWTEYAWVLTRLWESFPRAALLGDQAAGVVIDQDLLRPVDHEGAFYRVAGPLDGPSSVQGRPVIVADLGALDAAAVARSADVVVVDRERAAGADTALAEALRRAGRSRSDVALLGRVRVTAADPAALAGDLRAWAGEDQLDGFELVPAGDVEAVVAALRALVPRLTDPAAPPPTLRAAFGLPEVAAVLS